MSMIGSVLVMAVALVSPLDEAPGSHAPELTGAQLGAISSYMLMSAACQGLSAKIDFQETSNSVFKTLKKLGMSPDDIEVMLTKIIVEGSETAIKRVHENASSKGLTERAYCDLDLPFRKNRFETLFQR